MVAGGLDEEGTKGAWLVPWAVQRGAGGTVKATKELWLNALQGMQWQIGRGTQLAPASLTVIKQALGILLMEFNCSRELVGLQIPGCPVPIAKGSSRASDKKKS